jgi:hypothetical protein
MMYRQGSFWYVIGMIGMDGCTRCTGRIQVLERYHGHTCMANDGSSWHARGIAMVQGDNTLARWNYLVSCGDLLAWCVEHFVPGFKSVGMDVEHKRGGIKGETCP